MDLSREVTTTADEKIWQQSKDCQWSSRIEEILGSQEETECFGSDFEHISEETSNHVIPFNLRQPQIMLPRDFFKRFPTPRPKSRPRWCQRGAPCCQSHPQQAHEVSKSTARPDFCRCRLSSWSTNSRPALGYIQFSRGGGGALEQIMLVSVLPLREKKKNKNPASEISGICSGNRAYS